MNPVSKSLFILCVVSSLTACSGIQKWNIVSQQKTLHEIQWTEEEKDQDYAIRNLRTTDEASFHVVRLRTAEKPHLHETHDLTVFVLKGKARLHLGKRVLDVVEGDVIEIPKGTVHWVENLHRDPSEVYVVFTPPFDGQDMKLVEGR